jgi:hypothetical protein
MNRRGFLSLIPVMAAVPFLDRLKTKMPVMSLVQRQRLEPDAHEMTFADVDLMKMSGPLQLRAKGNALWIESVSWEEHDGTRHSEIIRRNLPPGKGMMLPTMNDVHSITFAVTCLPLASSATLVELAG